VIIQTSLAKINVEVFPSKKKDSEFVFLLHGFTGSSEDWLEIIPQLNPNFSYVAIDLIGHGKSECPADEKLYRPESITQQLDEVFNHFTKNKITLIGYSMGGRAALTYAVHHPEKLSGLILESTSAGIADEKLREERRQADEKIIKLIEEKSIDEFVEFWMNQDLFASQKNLPQKTTARSKRLKARSSKLGLINSLKGFGTGVMPALYNEIHLVKCKTLLITGELDQKFTQINSELVKSFPTAKHVIIKNAGHNVHLEKEEEFVSSTYDFFNQS
jgi:2-succinyl-6-hydroxy-2,4-cyclohexadiene-1-carboxylate synthase